MNARVMLRLLLLPTVLALATDAPLPALPNDLCDLDTVYDSIRTGQVIEHELQVRYRDCPSNRVNQPCGVDLGQGSPGPWLDGVRSNMITINNDYPGPAIHANLGDTVRVTVVNYLSEPTSMHFFGISQFRTPYMDGDEMTSNCPIPTGFNFTYEFIAYPAGSTWYQGHVGSQHVAGMTGPLIVHDPASDGARDDAKDHVAFFTDWYHQNADDNFFFWAQNTPLSGCFTFGGPRYTGRVNPENLESGSQAGAVVGDGYLFQSLLVNGRGSYDYQATQVTGLGAGGLTYAEQQCPGQTDVPPQCEVCLDSGNFSSYPCTTSSDAATCGQMEIFNVVPGEESRLRLIHGGALFSFQVCIDGHPINVIAADGARTEAYEVDCVIINPGERYDVMVNATYPPGDYLVRFTTLEQQNLEDSAANAGTFGTDTTGMPHQAFALLRYAEDNVTAPATAVSRQIFTGQEPPPCGCTDFGCTTNFSSNCNADYWSTSSTLGCSMESVRNDPGRCRSVFELRANYTSHDQCGGKRMAHEADPTVQVTTSIHLFPGEVPRWEALALSGRMEIIREEDGGFPYVTPTNSSAWGVVQPISFVGPPEPLVPLNLAARREIYDRLIIFRDMDNASYIGPNSTPPYPDMFALGTQGTNALEVRYGDVVRIFIKCSQPYGAGCGMGQPMHLHGNKMAVIGYGAWNETYNASNFNLENPVYRDTVQALTDGWMVLQFVANNPGVWRFHTNLNSHHRGGIAMLFDVGGDDEAVMAVRSTPEADNMCPQYLSSLSSPQAQSGPTNVAIAGAVIAIVCVATICAGVAAASWTTRK